MQLVDTYPDHKTYQLLLTIFQRMAVSSKHERKNIPQIYIANFGHYS